MANVRVYSSYEELKADRVVRDKSAEEVEKELQAAAALKRIRPKPKSN